MAAVGQDKAGHAVRGEVVDEVLHPGVALVRQYGQCRHQVTLCQWLFTITFFIVHTVVFGIKNFYVSDKKQQLKARRTLCEGTTSGCATIGIIAGGQPLLPIEGAVMLVSLDQIQLAIPVGGEEAARQFYGQVLGVGVRRFYANDPFGNRIEFIQDGDGFSQLLSIS